MARLLVVYGTTEGQTRKIAERLTEQARARGYEVEMFDATALPAELEVSGFAAVIVAGSIHVWRHQSSIERFVRAHLGALRERSGAFVSVSLSAAGDAKDRSDAQGCVDRFLAATGWRPTSIYLAAGAFRFTRYGFLKRWIMRRIARRKGGPTDTSRDHEYTDWAGLERFLDEFLAAVG